MLRLFAGGWLALLLALQPAHAQRARPWGAGITGQVVLDASAANDWIPFARTAGGLVAVRATVNDKPMLALVDTGAPYTVMDAGFAQLNGIKLLRTVAPGKNRVSVYVGAIDRMRVGPITQTGGRLAAIDLSRMGNVMGMPITMILGADYLRTLAVEFDFDRARLRLRASGSKGPEGITVPLTMMAPANRFIISMRIGEVPVNRVLIDTGINATLSVTTPVWKRLPLAGVRVTTTQAYSLYGKVIWPLARFEGAAIGPAPIPGKVEIINDEDGILDTPADALIGMEALRYFNVFLDARARIMILSPRSVPHGAQPLSTIGILGHGAEKGFAVEHVMKGSPAAFAGIADGDVVCTVDGASIARGTPGSRENWAGQPVGTRLSIGLCSGRTVPLTLAEFY